MSADALAFFLAWMAAPLRVASVTPSSEALAELITSEISGSTGPVLELGPGTGVFTRALIRRQVVPGDLTLVELDRDFAALLRQRFPNARVLEIDAAAIGRAPLFDDAVAGATVSGLPLLSMPPPKVTAILAGSFRWLRPGGAFYQFTYGPRCPIAPAILERLNLKAERVGRTLRNLPPAAVYRITRGNPASADETMTGREA